MPVLDASAVLAIPWGIDYASVVVGVLTGAMFGCRSKLDVVGTTVAGFLTGFGGGIVRDLLLGASNIYFMSHPDLILVSLAICLLTFYFRGVFLDLNRSILVADTLSVALFALAGSSKAFAYGLDPVYVVILGSNFYAVACLGGSVAFAAMAYFGLPLVAAGFGCVGAVLALRYLSIRFDWKTREYCDLTPRVVAAAKSASSSSHQPDRLDALPNGRED